jgi:uncharacterized protein (TIGR02444 family)
MAEEPTQGAQDSPFWRFSLRFYRNPEVAAACIALQDEAGVDVNVLFFLLWNATLKRTLPQAAIAELDARIGAWRNAAVIPLRELRRALKVPPPVVAPGAAEAFRTRVKAVELEAERLQQQTMYALTPSLPFAGADTAMAAASASIDGYAAVSAKPFPSAAVATILAAFAQVTGDADRPD